MLAISGASTGLVHGLRTGDVGGQLGRLTLAALAQSPAVWIVGAVTVLLVGWLPHAASAAWGVLVTCVVLGQFGALLSLPQALIDVSPFGHVPGIANITVAPLAVLTVIALGLAGVGLLDPRRRDISAESLASPASPSGTDIGWMYGRCERAPGAPGRGR